MKEALPDLIARFYINRGFFRKEAVDTHLYALDQFGCVMKTDKIFNPGDTLQLDLIVDMPFENIHVKGVTGLITERRKQFSNFFYFIDFMPESSYLRPSAIARLSRIRDVVNKKQSLRSRRVSGRSSNLKQMA